MAGNIFDYVVIGGGSGGSVMAGRLSEDPKTSVVLLEAGGSGRRIGWGSGRRRWAAEREGADGLERGRRVYG